MKFSRRSFLARAGGIGVLAGAGHIPAAAQGAALAASRDDWEAVRAEFDIDLRWAHMAGFYLSAHPRVVREAIDLHRRNLDANPVHYLNGIGSDLESRVREAAAAYLGASATDIALTESTTMGLTVVYNGLDLRPGDEVLTTTHDHRVTRESLDFKAARSGARISRIELYREGARATRDEVVASLAGAIRPQTRAVAVTWVHSSTGVKLPVRDLAEVVARANVGRDAAERVLLCVDGVHGLGVEDAGVQDLGCDVFVAGTHKSLYGPRGTGMIWAHPRAQDRLSPTVPSFTRDGTWGGAMSPGGFQPFEHRWALREAFEFHQQIGKSRVSERIHGLNTQLKEGLAGMRHVKMHTPLSTVLSAGMVCFEVDGLAPAEVVARLRDGRIIASTTPYTPSYARLAPGLLNTPEEVDVALEAVRALS